MKIWGTSLKITKNFKTVTAEYETKHRISAGHVWLHRPHIHEADPGVKPVVHLKTYASVQVIE